MTCHGFIIPDGIGNRGYKEACLITIGLVPDSVSGYQVNATVQQLLVSNAATEF